MALSKRHEDALLEQACDHMNWELRRFQDSGVYDSHPAREALEKLGAAADRLYVHAYGGIENLLRPTDADPIEELRAMDADRHEGHFREDEVSKEGRRPRSEAFRLPRDLITAVIELHRAIQGKGREIGTRKRWHWKTRCYADCLSDAELVVRALLEGEPWEPGSARVALFR